MALLKALCWALIFIIRINSAMLNSVRVIFSFTVVDEITPHNGTHKQLTNVHFKSPESPQFYFSKILSTKNLSKT